MRLLILTLAAAMLFAQENKPPESNPDGATAEIITVKTLTGDSFDRLLNLLNVFPAKFKGDSQLRTIVVYGSKDVVAQMRRVVEQLDRPGSEAAIGRNIEMTLTLLRCSTRPATASAGALPADIEAVARQLRNATQYKDVQLLDVVPLRLQEGRESRETLALPGMASVPGTQAIGTIVIRPESVYRKQQARFVRFARLDIDLRVPVATGSMRGPAATTQYSYVNVGLATSGDFTEGQKTVIGKVSGSAEDEAIFAVIALKVLD